MYWTSSHNLVMCREIAFENPYKYKKATQQRSSVWKSIADALNKCVQPQFNVDTKAIKDHLGVLFKHHKKKLRYEERASGIEVEKPTELEQLLDEILELEKNAPTEAPSSKESVDKAKAEDVRMKAMERLSQTKKRVDEGEGEPTPKKKTRRSTVDAMEYLKERAEMNTAIKEKELAQEENRQQQQLQIQQQQADMLKVMQQQQHQYQLQQQQYQQQQQQMQQQQMLMMQQVMGVMGKMMQK